MATNTAPLIISKAPAGMVVCFGQTQAHYVKGLQTLCGVFVSLPNLSLYPTGDKRYLVCPVCRQLAEKLINAEPVHP